MATAVAPAPAAAGAAPAPLASASLYVGDLDPGITEPQLFEVFSVVGPVASIRVCRDAMTRRSLGYAYVNFHNVVDAERALDTLNYTAVKGKACRIMWKHRDPSMRKSGQGNIFIKNLDKSVDTRTLHDTFSQFGNILSCKVSMDDQANSRGFGFVQFETAEEANEAIAKVNGMLLEDKRLYVGPFLARNERDSVTGERKYTNVYVKNVPDDVTDEKFKEAFAKFGEVTSAVVMRKPDGTSKGFGFVNYKEADQAKAGVDALNGTKAFGGEKDLYAGRAEKESERKDKLRKKYDSIRMDRLKNNQLVNLYIKNLDDAIDDDKLRTSFEQFGTITSAKVMRDKDRPEISKGFGFVCFSAPEEATRAVTAMNGQMLGTKPIYVALHQPIEIRRQMQAAQSARQQPMLPRFQVQVGAPGMPMGGAMPMGFAGGRPGPGQVFMFPPQMGGAQMGQPFRQQPYRQQQGQFAMMPPQQQQQRRGQQGQYQGVPQAGRGIPAGQVVGAPGAQRPGQPGAAPARQGKAQAGVQMTGQARNMPQQAGAAAAPAPAQQAVPAAAAIPPSSMSKDQLMQMLVNAPQAQAKQILGERLYALIQPEQGPLAGKITGMLLEGLDNSELVALIDDHNALRNKIREALAALEAHAQAQQRAT
uniref:Polyadenylate-binding protein n=1 Tax=Cryptomonas curvata TaxID=233186 RepID=A0A7S0NAG1_9CRYP|mmetsp:Transcript_8217/g.17618  ORF Transcript_8217/g.17618 Transcript_8217/m.17618 type:complete len:646 (+) Transcript_8217:158-2095(+)